jgi:hypothetical protein
MSLNVLADQEEGGFEVTRFEQIQEPRRVFNTGTIVKRHGHVRAMDAHMSAPGRTRLLPPSQRPLQPPVFRSLPLSKDFSQNGFSSS